MLGTEQNERFGSAVAAAAAASESNNFKSDPQAVTLKTGEAKRGKEEKLGLTGRNT